MTNMETILIVNAGSSSLKFQVFALDTLPELKCLVKGQIDGIGTRAHICSAKQQAKSRHQPKVYASICGDISCVDYPFPALGFAG